jgi:hypothetical protein
MRVIPAFGRRFLLAGILFTASTPLEKSGKLPDKQALDTLPLLDSRQAGKEAPHHDDSHFRCFTDSEPGPST